MLNPFSVLKAVNVDANLPTFKSPDLEKMGNSTALIPTAPVDSLNTLNSSIPTLSQLRDLIENQSVRSLTCRVLLLIIQQNSQTIHARGRLHQKRNGRASLQHDRPQ